MNFNTKVINFFAPPGSGKSTTAAGTFFKMKLLGFSVELVTEFAKDMVWSRRYNEMANQSYITAKQFHRMYRLVGQVDWIVTDSPLLLGLIYKEDNYFLHFDDFLKEQFNAFDNTNILLKRTKLYNPKGRLQSEKESDCLAGAVMDLLIDNKLNYHIIDGNDRAPDKVIEIIKGGLESI